MGNGMDLLVATFISVIVVLAAMLIAQWLIELKFSQYWYALPLMWFLFILLNSLFGLFFLPHNDFSIKSFLDMLSGILIYSSPALIPIALHFFLERKRRKENPEDY